MPEGSKIEEGREVARRLFGEKRVEKIEIALEKMSDGFRKFVMESFDVYNRPALDSKMRSIITIAVLTATGKTQELELHVRGGISVGLTEEQIREIIMQVAIYAGIPAAIEAYLAANKVFAKIDDEQRR